MTRALLPGVVGLLVLQACVDTDGSGARGRVDVGVTVRDSAGIRIVENHDSAWTEATRWRVADEPDLRIGSLDGISPGTDWGGYVEVRSFGDRIAVIDFMSVSVRVFAGDGSHLRTLELRGGGPMEVDAVSDVAPVGADSIAVWSGVSARMLRLDIASGSGTSLRVDDDVLADLNYPRMLGWFEDGSWVLADTPDPDAMDVGRRMMSGAYEHFASDGTHLGRIARLPIQEIWKVDEGVSGAVAFAAPAWTMVGPTHLWHSHPVGQAQVERIDPATGSLDRMIRLPLHPTPVKPEWIARSRRQLRRQMEPLLEEPGMPAELRRRFERQLDAQEYADSTASIGQFHTGRDGTLWIVPADTELIERQTELPDDADPLAFLDEFLEDFRQPVLVVDSAGRWLGTLELPTRFDVHEYGSDYVLGTRSDEFDVPYVERYRIIKPEQVGPE